MRANPKPTPDIPKGHLAINVQCVLCTIPCHCANTTMCNNLCSWCLSLLCVDDIECLHWLVNIFKIFTIYCAFCCIYLFKFYVFHHIIYYFIHYVVQVLIIPTTSMLCDFHFICCYLLICRSICCTSSFNGTFVSLEFKKQIQSKF